MRHLHLNALIYGTGSHVASWRHPSVDPLAITDLDYWINLAKMAEQGGFDALFLGDILALPNELPYYLAGELDPTVILSALAAVTTKIGLISTVSTSFDHPYNLARRLASLDHISKGRAGWNIVTSDTLPEARNFGRDAIAPEEERYARAEDVLNGVLTLWDSWRPHARIADKQSGLYLDNGSVHQANYRGSYTRSIGPLNVPRPPQGRPLLVQGGTSNAGRRFASKHADIVITKQCNMEEAVAFANDIRVKAEANGRKDGDVLIFPSIVPIIGKTREEAEANLRELSELTLLRSAILQISHLLQCDLSLLDYRKPLPQKLLALTDSAKLSNTARQLLREAKRNNWTLGKLAEYYLCARGHYLVVGTAQDIAEAMEQWFHAGAADGFNVIFPLLPNTLEEFCQDVIPLLAARGLLKPVDADNDIMLRERYGFARKTLAKLCQAGNGQHEPKNGQFKLH